MRATARLVLGLALAIATPALAQQAPPKPGTPSDFSVPTARTLALPNGLQVSMVPYGALPKVSVRLVSGVGNVHESAEQVWLADLTADLMQQGTTSRTAEEIARSVAAMGGALNVGVGANTTTVSGDVLAEFGPQLVALIADVMRNPSFPESELPRLKADRVRQITIDKSRPQQLALEKFRAVMYPNHPYGRVFPTPEQVQGYTVEQIRQFHAANYGAARSRLYITGRFDAAAMEQAVRQAFADWQRGPAPQMDIPTPTSRRAIHVVDRPGAVQSTISLGLPVVDPSHPDYLALQVTNSLLGGSFGSRITANIRENKGYTYSPFSSLSARYRDAYWVQQADVTTDVTGPSLKEIFYEIDRLRREPPTADELRGIQNYLAGLFVLQNSSRAGIINQLSFIDLHGLPSNYLNTYVQRVYAVTPADVQRIARQYLDADKMQIVIVGDRGKIVEQVRAFGEIVN